MTAPTVRMHGPRRQPSCNVLHIAALVRRGVISKLGEYPHPTMITPIRCRARILISAACLALLPLLAFPVHAQTTYYYKPDNTTTGNWSASNAWNTNAAGTGTNHTLSTANSNIYNTNAKAMRTTGTTFAGGSLILSGHSTDAGGANYSLMLTSPGMTIANLSTQAYDSSNNFVLIRATLNSATALSSTNFAVGTETRFHFQTTNFRSLNFTLTTLTGSGDMHMGKTGAGTDGASTIALSATNASAYTGDIIVYNGTSMDFNSTFTSGGGLSLLSGAVLTLDQSLSFTSLSIGGSSLSAGTYSFATLNGLYDAYFANGGTGSITVTAVPEPSAAAALLGVAALAAFTVRRRLAARA